MPRLDSAHSVPERKKSAAPHNQSRSQRINPRPQRLHTWLTLIPVREFEDTRPDTVEFLDSPATRSFTPQLDRHPPRSDVVALLQPVEQLPQAASGSFAPQSALAKVAPAIRCDLRWTATLHAIYGPQSAWRQTTEERG